MSPELALQTIVFGEISTALPSVPSGAQPPANRPLPYIQFGQTSTEDHEAGHVVTIELHYWSSAEGPHEVKEHADAVRDALHGTSKTGNGWRFSCIRELSNDVLLDVDDETWHCVQRMRAIAVLE